jgi:uncharacterized protein (DUF433 family)
MDWSGCELVEVIPGKVSGVPRVIGTRIPADVIVKNFSAGSPVEEIEEHYPALSRKTITRCFPTLSRAACKRPRESTPRRRPSA